MNGLAKYLGVAFANRWNLLAFLGGLGFAVLTGRPDIFGPLVIAGELTYLGFLGTHPKFQKYVDAKLHAERRQATSETAGETLQHILRSLSKSTLRRYDQLRNRCLELRRIANELRRTSAAGDGVPFDSLQVSSFDRLLWMFLRLLFTQHALGKFLDQTNGERIHRDILELESRLQAVPPDDQSPHRQKLRRTLEDNLQTCRDRLANYEKAQANHELVGLEIDRLENKITSLAELAINRQEPDYISSQVDQVAGSMLETEKTISDLQFATGLGPLQEEIPDLVESAPVLHIE